ncbi:restriction endonuclease subunit R, partial [bacterium]|nr:restriction endonuclease subunit R [bacterium]
MRSVKSRNYFEQMKGRGVRVIRSDDFKVVSPDAMAKERFVIVDAVGVCESEDLSDTWPLDQKPLVSFTKLLKALRFGKPNADNLSSMASRLSRLEKKLTEEQKTEIERITGGDSLSDFARGFVVAIDPDRIFSQAREEFAGEGSYLEYVPKKKELGDVARRRMEEALQSFTGNPELMGRLPEIKQEAEQIIDDVSLDVVEEAGYSPIAKEKAKGIIKSFKEFIEENKDELTAIKVFYNPGELHWNDLKSLADKIKTPPHNITVDRLWQAYQQLEKSKVHGKSRNKVSDFVSLLRFELGKTNYLEPFNDTVDKRFSAWLSKQREQGVEFTQEQLNWL